MTAYRKRQIGELSGGQKKRVFLARALAQEGRVILLDEPFTGVDVKTEEQIIALAARTARRRARDAGLDPQSRQRAGVLRPGGADQPHRAGLRARRARSSRAANLERAFGGVLRHFVLGGADLHDDDDTRSVTVLTDDERPLRRSTATSRRAAGDQGEQGAELIAELLLEPFAYGYMIKAMWVSALVGGVCAFLSAYLMLKGWSLIGDALSHSIVPGRRRRLHARPAVRARRVLRRRARRRRDAVRQPAHQAARGCDHRPDLHRLSSGSACSWCRSRRPRSTSRPSCSATSWRSRRGHAAARDHRRVSLGDPAR